MTRDFPNDDAFTPLERIVRRDAADNSLAIDFL
jgi:hypothetical protein